MKRFKEEFIKDGKRKKIKWEQQPVPTIHSKEALKRPSVLPTSSSIRKAPKLRLQKDELDIFQNDDIIASFNDLTAKNVPPGYLYHQTKDYVIYYHLVFEENCGFPLF